MTPQLLLERLVYAIDTHRRAKRRWERMDLRRMSDRVNAEQIRADYIEASTLLREAEHLASTYVTLIKERESA